MASSYYRLLIRLYIAGNVIPEGEYAEFWLEKKEEKQLGGSRCGSLRNHGRMRRLGLGKFFWVRIKLMKERPFILGREVCYGDFIITGMLEAHEEDW